MNEIDDLLSFDPLGEAEKITGKSYKEDDFTTLLGLYLARGNAGKKEVALMEGDDSHFNMSWEDSIDLYTRLGFEEVFSEEFEYNKYSLEAQECFKVFWKDGFMLAVTSFSNQTVVNTANLYYNWVPDVVDTYSQHISSGRFSREHENVWGGYTDVREGLRRTVNDLTEHGTVLDVWVSNPLLFLVNFSYEGDYQEETNRVVSLLPEDIQEKVRVGVRKG